MDEQPGLLLVADFPQMNFSQMHERLRLELLRRIERGTLSVSLLARQTGFGQSHISNFLRSRRQLSLEALDRVLTAQRMTAADLLPVKYNHGEWSGDDENGRIPLVSHASALFEPFIRPNSVRTMLQFPAALLATARSRSPSSRKTWQRFVAISIPAADASPMEPLVLADAIVLIDRHYNSLMPYRLNRPNLYAVRNGGHLALRYLDFLLNRLVLRPYNLAFPVELVEVPPGETPGDLIAGRIVLILNEF
jgi:transcriptional regulator with XRE-family HTH domain